MQRSHLMPFFWTQLVASALLAGTVFTGCAAGGGNGEDPIDDLASPSTAAPTRPVTTPSSTPPQSPSSTPAATGSTPVTTNTTPAGSNEQTPTPSRDDGATPPAAAEDTANPGGGAQAGDEDGDDDDDDGADEADDGDDDDGDDDDDGGDDDDGDDDDDDDDVGSNPVPNPDPVTPPAGDAVTFTADIRPILLDNCGRCHASGGLPQFASNDAARGYDVAFAERNSIVSEISGGDMPADTCNGAPGSNGCVSAEDFALIQQWVAAGAPE